MILIFFNSNNEIKIIVKVKVENIRAYECHKVENFFEKKNEKKKLPTILLKMKFDWLKLRIPLTDWLNHAGTGL